MPIQPALTPLHPDKPPREIVAGETWTKKASQKCSNKRPTCRVVSAYTTRGGASWVTIFENGTQRMTREHIFRRDYE